MSIVSPIPSYVRFGSVTGLVSYRGQEPTCRRCRATGHIARVCPQLPRCFNCRADGHISRDCPESRRCRLCGVAGHQAADCAKYWVAVNDPDLVDVPLSSSMDVQQSSFPLESVPSSVPVPSASTSQSRSWASIVDSASSSVAVPPSSVAKSSVPSDSNNVAEIDDEVEEDEEDAEEEEVEEEEEEAEEDVVEVDGGFLFKSSGSRYQLKDFPSKDVLLGFAFWSEFLKAYSRRDKSVERPPPSLAVPPGVAKHMKLLKRVSRNVFRGASGTQYDVTRFPDESALRSFAAYKESVLEYHRAVTFKKT